MKSLKYFRLLALLACLLHGVVDVNAQDLKGRDFWFSVPNFSPLAGGASYGRFVYVVSDFCIDTAKIEIPELGWEQTFSVTRGEYTEITLPSTIAGQPIYHRRALQIEGKGVHVEAPLPVTVYLALVDQASSDGETIIPNSKLGTKYVMPMRGMLAQGAARSIIIATEDNTNVTLQTWDAAGNPVTDTVLLNRGQTYMRAQTRSMCNADYPGGVIDKCSTFDGSVIKADKPISVMGSVDCSWGGECGACEVLMVNALPESRWGTKFVTAQIIPRANPAAGNCFASNANSGDFFQIIGEVGTNVTITNREGTNTFTIPPLPYENGAGYGYGYIFKQVAAQTGLGATDFGFVNNLITADRPIQVMQYPKGWQTDNVGSADPEGIYVHPVDSWDDSYLFAVLFKAGATTQNDIAIIVEDVGAPLPTTQIELNGTNVGAGGWTTIPNTNYKYKLVPTVLSIQTNRIISRSGAPLGIYSLSRAQANSFITYGGAGDVLDIPQCPDCPIADFDPDKRDYCLGEISQFTDQSLDNDPSGATQIVEWVWDYGDGTVDTFYTSTDPSHKYANPGTYLVTLSVTNNNTAQPPCTQSYTIAVRVGESLKVDAGPDITACRGDVVTIGGSPTAEGGEPPLVYTWSPAAGLSNAWAANPELTVTISDEYIVEVRDSINCTLEDTLVVTMLESDSVYLRINPGNNTICEGDSYGIEVVGLTTQGSPYDLVISDGANSFTRGGINAGDTISVSPSTTTNYTIVSVSGSVDSQCMSFSPDPVQVKVVPNPDVRILGATDPICLGSDVDVNVNVTGTGPWNVAYQFEDNPSQTVTGINQSPFVITITPSDSGTFYITQVEYNGFPQCTQSITDEMHPIQVKFPRDPGADQSIEICQEDGPVDLRTVLSPNAEPGGSWFDTDGSGGLESPTSIFNPARVDKGVYNIQYVLSDNAPCPDTSATIAITVDGPPVANIVKEDSCEADLQSYRVFLDVFANNPSSPDGQFTNNNDGSWRFVSNFFPNKTNYAITIQGDNNCDPLVLQGYVNCGCKSVTGSMSNTTIDICQSDSAYGDHDGKHFTLPQDTLIFFLHEGNATQIVNPVDSNAVPDFAYDPAKGIQLDKKYYISPVVGPKLNGTVDMSNECVKVGQGQPVRWNTQVDASFELVDPELCVGPNEEQLQVAVIFQNGSPPYSASWAGKDFQPDSTFINLAQIDTMRGAPIVSDSLYITQFSDQFCTVDTLVKFEYFTHSNPTAINFQKTCNGTLTDYVLEFDVVDADNSTMQVDQVRGTGTFDPNTGHFITDPIPTGDSVHFEFYDQYDCGTLVVVRSEVCDCISEAGTLADKPSNYNTYIGCGHQDSAVFVERLLPVNEVSDANDVLNYVLHKFPGDYFGQGSYIATYPDSVIKFIPASMSVNKDYYVTAFMGSDIDGDGLVEPDDKCLDTSNTVTVQYIPLPDAQFTDDITVCDEPGGPIVNLPVKYSGVGPFEVEFMDDLGNITTVSGLNNGDPISVNPPGPGTYTYTITSVADASGIRGCKDDAVTHVYKTVTVTQAPTASISVPSDVCAETEAAVQINLTGAPDFSFDLMNSVDGIVASFNNESRTSYTVNHAPSDTSTYTVVNLTDAICSGSSNTAPVNVNLKPVVTLSAPNTICEGNQLDIAVNIVGSNAPYDVSVKISDAFSSSSQDGNTINGNQGTLQDVLYFEGITTYEVVAVTDGSSPVCSGSGNTITVERLDLPTGEAISDDLVCLGDEGIIAVDLKGTGNFTYYLEDIGGTTYGPYYANDEGVDSANVLINSQGKHQLFVTSVLDNNNCPNDDNGEKIAELEVVTVPEVDFAVTDPEDCPPLETRFINTTASTDTRRCTWTIDDNVVVNGCQDFGYVYETSGIRDVTLEVEFNSGCIASKTQFAAVNVYPVPEPDFYWFPKNPTIVEPVVNFSSTSLFTEFVRWEFDTLGVENGPNAFFVFPDDDEGKYDIKLIATSPMGCIDSITYPIYVRGELLIYVPTAFSPNGDDLNDILLPRVNGDNEHINAYEFAIFNRWGEMMFFTEEVTEGWDGRHNGQLVPPGVYAYKLKVKSKFDAKREVIGGVITVIR